MMCGGRAIQLLVLAVAGGVLGVLIAPGHEEGRASGYFPGQSGQSAAAEGITVTGVGQVRVARPPKPSDPTIRAAVGAARRAAYPIAAQDAREAAEAVAHTLGMGLGAVEAAVEGEDNYSSGRFGRFGADRYCGVVSRRIFGRNSSGERVVRRVVRRRTCVVPKQSVVVLTVRYATG